MKALFLLLSLIIPGVCSSHIHGACSTSAIAQDCTVAKSKVAGSIDTTFISRLSNDITRGSLPNVHSVLVYKDGMLLYEKYWCGKDEKHGRNLGRTEHNSSTLHDMRSISKSVVSACIGIAVRRRLIKSIDDPLNLYFLELKDDKRGLITIRNLLTMTSGLSWKEIGTYNALLNDETRMDLVLHP